MVNFFGFLRCFKEQQMLFVRQVINYLSVKAPVVLEGGATNSASVMVGSHMGVVTKIKDVVPKFISTHCSAY